MGRTNSSMKIHWDGQTGGLVGFTVRGNAYWRSLADHVRNPRTQAQTEHRALFAFVSALIRCVGPIYKEGYLHYNTRKPQRANFFQQLYRNAVTGDISSGFTVNYANVLVARGNLTPAYNTLAVVTASSQTVTVSWSDNTGVGDASATDTLSYALYNTSKQTNVLGTAVATRADETAEFTYPAEWAGDTLHLYLFWSNGTTESDSQHLGPYTA